MRVKVSDVKTETEAFFKKNKKTIILIFVKRLLVMIMQKRKL
ncbi:hypothetical protein [Borrelia duttonii]|nr:hypothetical protein [Borrelia duttonii]